MAIQENAQLTTTLYTQADLRRLACRVLAQLEGIALEPLERDIQVSTVSEGLTLDCRVVACMGTPLLQLGRRAQGALTEAIQATTARPLCEIRIIIDDIAPAHSITKLSEE